MVCGRFCYVIWEKYVGGSGEFYGPPTGQPGAEWYAYDLPIPESCMEPFPLKDAIFAISKNKDAQAQCRMRKEELSNMSSALIKEYDEWLGFLSEKEFCEQDYIHFGMKKKCQPKQ